MGAHLVNDLLLDELWDTDYAYRESALISLAMYGRAESPLYAAIWVDSNFGGGDNAPVRPRAFVPDWDDDTIEQRRGDGWLPTLVGITAWDFEQPRSLLVFEQFPSTAPAPKVVTATKPSQIHLAGQLGVLTGLDMCVQRTIVPAKGNATKAQTKEITVGVVYPTPALPAARSLYNVLRLSPCKDKLDGIWSSSEHRAVLAGWSRGHHAIPYPRNVQGNKRQAVVHYQNDTFAPWPNDMLAHFDCGTPIEGPIKASDVGQRVAAAAAKGYWPIRVGANGHNSHRRFCITWAKKPRLFPKKRYSIVVGSVDPTQRRISAPGAPVVTVSGGLDSAPVGFAPAIPTVPVASQANSELEDRIQEMDDAILARLRATGCYAAQLAIAKDSKLKIVRSYTVGEQNYPITNAHHMFRWASVVKMLVGMFAATHGEKRIFKDTIHDLFPTLPTTAEHRDWFQQLTLADLLRHQSGWDDDNDGSYDYFNAAYNHGRQLLPLRPGDFGNMLVKSKLHFEREPPKQAERYNNFNFAAAGEALSAIHHGKTDRTRFLTDIQDFWKGSGPSVAHRAMAVPRTQALCLSAGEVPMRVVPALDRATLVGNGKQRETEEGGPPPVVARGYNVGRDGEFGAAFGYTIMSATMLVRILQGMYPGAIPPVQQLLQPEHIQHLLKINPAATTVTGLPGKQGLAGSFVKGTYGGHPDTLRLAHQGSVTVGTSVAYHYIWQRYAIEHHLSIALIMNGNLGDSLMNTVVDNVEAIEENDLWDDATNLFPEFFQ